MSENVEIGLKDFLKLLGKRCWVIILGALILGTAVLLYTKQMVKPQYEASIKIFVNNNSQDGSPITSGDQQVARRLVATYIGIIESDTVLDKVIAECGVNLDAGKLKRMITAEAVGETEIFQLTVKSENPQLSMDLANTIAKVAPDVIKEFIKGSDTQILDWAKLPKGPSGPNYTFNAMLGVIIGAALSIVGLLVYMLLDTRIKGEEDIGKICRIPIVGTIPNLTTDSKKPVKKGRR